MRQDGDRLHALRRSSATRIDQVAITLAADFEIALVIARSPDGFAVMQLHRGNRPRFARMLNADTPRAITVLPQRQHIAADIDQRVVDALLFQQLRRSIQRIAFGVAAEIEQHGLVIATHQLTFAIGLGLS